MKNYITNNTLYSLHCFLKDKKIIRFVNPLLLSHDSKFIMFTKELSVCDLRDTSFKNFCFNVL